MNINYDDDYEDEDDYAEDDYEEENINMNTTEEIKREFLFVTLNLGGEVLEFSEDHRAWLFLCTYLQAGIKVSMREKTKLKKLDEYLGGPRARELRLQLRREARRLKKKS